MPGHVWGPQTKPTSRITRSSSAVAWIILFLIQSKQGKLFHLLRRLMAPAEEYVSTFAPTLQRAQLAWRCAAVMFDHPSISYEAALPHVRP